MLLMLFAACKPTEKGYRAAYDAAKSKREQADPDQDILTGGHKLLNEDATRWVIIDGDSLQMEHFFLQPEEGSRWPQTGPYRLAVAMFKMTTNVNSMLNDIKGKGTLTPTAAFDSKGRHFIIAGSATYVDSLSNVLSTFKKENPGFSYIGMTGNRPMVIVGR